MSTDHADPPVPSPQTGEMRGVIAGPARVAVVEDDPEMRALIASTLRCDGYAVVELRGGDAFIAYLGDTLRQAALPRVDAIVSDIRMPGLSGMDLLAGLRKVSTIPFILITAFGSPETHAEARSLGATAVLDKPFDMDELRSVVRRAVGPR